MPDTPIDGTVPYIDIEAFESGMIRRYAGRDTATIVRPGELLIVWDGARCDLVGITPFEGSLGSTLAALRSDDVDNRYLLYYLRSQYEYINAHPRGSGITHVDPEILWSLRVPIPPREEQKRIVARIEELLAHVNSARDRLARVKAIMKRFRQAVLAAAVSGRLTAD
jgi:type I restriction enzyme S subunit